MFFLQGAGSGVLIYFSPGVCVCVYVCVYMLGGEDSEKVSLNCSREQKLVRYTVKCFTLALASIAC